MKTTCTLFVLLVRIYDKTNSLNPVGVVKSLRCFFVCSDTVNLYRFCHRVYQKDKYQPNEKNIDSK